MTDEGEYIVRALKEQQEIRLSCGWRWMTWDDDDEEWVVREHKPYQRGTTVVEATRSERIAVEKLVEA